jgi:hypothetical protein
VVSGVSADKNNSAKAFYRLSDAKLGLYLAVRKVADLAPGDKR